ncbi:Histidine utilization repressor [Pacificimonas flava]|uniref:Histidine utilization repressor n=1 Tax=Pacificimonas flava TaxID=1234595 RepID=M2TNT0_9SPHN|nr:Histidine utilization repressor [Pacificimonas flava]
MQAFDVSRMTANRALRELQAAGRIIRRSGIGSFVAEPAPVGHMIEIRNIAEEIRGRGHKYSAQVLKNKGGKANVTNAALLGVPLSTKVFHSIIVHHEGGVPIQLEDRLVLAAIAPEYGKIDFAQTTPNEYLTRVAPLERVEHVVRARMPDKLTCERLELDSCEPVLIMIRKTWSGGRLASFARLTHPAPRFELSATFTVNGSANASR